MSITYLPASKFRELSEKMAKNSSSLERMLGYGRDPDSVVAYHAAIVVSPMTLEEFVLIEFHESAEAMKEAAEQAEALGEDSWWEPLTQAANRHAEACVAMCALAKKLSEDKKGKTP